MVCPHPKSPPQSKKISDGEISTGDYVVSNSSEQQVDRRFLLPQPVAPLRPKPSFPFPVKLMSSAGKGWFDRFSPTSSPYYSISDSTRKILIQQSSACGPKSHVEVCETMLPDGSYVFRAAGNQGPGRNLSDISWEFCGETGGVSEELVFSIQGGKCLAGQKSRLIHVQEIVSSPGGVDQAESQDGVVDVGWHFSNALALALQYAGSMAALLIVCGLFAVVVIQLRNGRLDQFSEVTADGRSSNKLTTNMSAVDQSESGRALLEEDESAHRNSDLDDHNLSLKHSRRKGRSSTLYRSLVPMTDIDYLSPNSLQSYLSGNALELGPAQMTQQAPQEVIVNVESDVGSGLLTKLDL